VKDWEAKDVRQGGERMVRIRDGKVAVAPMVMKACFGNDLVGGFWREDILR